MSKQNVNESMLDIFIFEISQLIEQLEKLILSNEEESSYSEDSINEIFRIMHTMKGSSSMMMFQNISSLAHAMEDLFFYIREEKPGNVDYEALSDLILECLDFIKVEVEKIKNGDSCDGEYKPIVKQITQLLGNMKNSQNGKESVLYKVVVFFEENCGMEHLRAFSIIHNLKELADEIRHIPENIDDADLCVDVIQRDGFTIFVKTEASIDEINDFFHHGEFVRDFEVANCEEKKEEPKCIEVDHTEEKQNKIQQGTPAREETSVNNQQSIISVGVGKLDKLMDLMGELVIAEEMVIQNSELKDLELDNFYKAARQLRKITNEMQDMVMTIRMVPLSATFHKMHRLIRDMSKKLGKEILLEIQGEETEVDKKIIEHISDPLMHLVRNAADHGFESPEEREDQGKSRTGTLKLEAKNAGGDVVITIKDDGRGLCKSEIMKKAKENEILTKPEEDYSDKEIYNLIFLPGFSTKKSVSEFSGRGVGMDVVSKNIEMVGGSVALDSTEGLGTTITLKIPLTLAIIDGMNIKVGDSHYTIPTVCVKEFFRARREEIITDPDNNEMIMVRGLCYPVLRLYEYYHVKNARTDFDEGIIIMAERDENVVCIFADELLGQQQVVVKALPEYIQRFKKIKGLTGCTLLGDGNISLILDIGGIVTT